MCYPVKLATINVANRSLDLTSNRYLPRKYEIQILLPLIMKSKFWDSKIETMSAEALHRLETPFLIRQLSRTYNQSPYYRQKFDRVKLKPESINSFEGLAEKTDLV
ncbi:MAG: hypothetical protein ACI845_000695 [Gammaproteobacteria bacterium]